jgi:ribosome-associated protein
MITVAQIPERELTMLAVRASGPGGQHVNKVATAIHLRFDVRGSSLPEALKTRLLTRSDKRLTEDGVIVIKAERFRSQDRNRTDALARLDAMLAAAQHIAKPRVATRPSRTAVRRRLDSKNRRGGVKRGRGRVKDW